MASQAGGRLVINKLSHKAKLTTDWPTTPLLILKRPESVQNKWFTVATLFIVVSPCPAFSRFLTVEFTGHGTKMSFATACLQNGHIVHYENMPMQ